MSQLKYRSWNSAVWLLVLKFAKEPLAVALCKLAPAKLWLQRDHPRSLQLTLKAKTMMSLEFTTTCKYIPYHNMNIICHLNITMRTCCGHWCIYIYIYWQNMIHLIHSNSIYLSGDGLLDGTTRYSSCITTYVSTCFYIWWTIIDLLRIQFVLACLGWAWQGKVPAQELCTSAPELVTNTLDWCQFSGVFVKFCDFKAWLPGSLDHLHWKPEVRSGMGTPLYG